MLEIDSHSLEAAAEFFDRQKGMQPSAESDAFAARIWAALDADLPDELRGAAYWALGKRCRNEEKKRFIAALRREIGRSSSVCYQIMIALDNLDEPVFSPDRTGYSVLESARNRADAERYLAQAE